MKVGYSQLADGTRAYVAVPDAQPRRGLVLLPSMVGFTPVIEGWCRALATEQGWSVVAPELLTDDEALGADGRAALMPTIDDDEVLRRLAVAADATGCADVGLLGFCVGGMYAIKGASEDRFDRVVAFYGMVRLPEDWRGPGQTEPLALVGAGAARLLGIFGGRDDLVPVEDLPALEAAGATVVRYPEADHAFAHDLAHPNHRPADAADAWLRAIRFLARGER